MTNNSDKTNTLIENKKAQERVILVGVALQRMEEEVKESLIELEELAKTAGAVTVGSVIQNLDRFNNATYVGKGKTEEIRELIFQWDATGIICDDELTPVQTKNLEKELNVKIMDRTMVILDIFAKHATTREGTIQVELAQLRYNLKRLSGQGTSMSRLGAGIGTRGPGEKKLETDRRHIRHRLSQLKVELDDIKRHRDMLRGQRKKQGKPMVAIVGYTNAGKSTLLNHLTDADVLEEDMLFATLDPTTRNLTLQEGKEVLLTDTVGFIRKLPHHLVEAFKSTLEEAVFADFLIHVVDCSNERAIKQMEVVYETLNQLNAGDKQVLTLFNKKDKEGANLYLKDLNAFDTLFISAKNEIGFDEVKTVLENKLREGIKLIKTTIPYDKGSILSEIRGYGQIIAEEYREDGTYIEAYLEDAYINKYKLLESKII